MNYVVSLGLAVVLPLVVLELTDLAAWLAYRLVRTAVKRLPEDSRGRFLEEWIGDLEHTPGKLTKLARAISLILLAPNLARAIRGQLPYTQAMLRNLQEGTRWLHPARIATTLSNAAALGLVAWAVQLIPITQRVRYRKEWRAELAMMRGHRLERVRKALEYLAWASDTGRAWRGRPPWLWVLRRLRRYEAGAIGLLTAAVWFAGFTSNVANPTPKQWLWGILGTLGSGVLAYIGWCKQFPYRPREDDLEAYEDDGDE